MKIGPLSGEPFYRMHTPRWAVMPTSGAGAAKHGGRFNRPGVAALYLADTTETAIAEYKQDLTLMPPGTLVQYELSLSAGGRNLVVYTELLGPNDVLRAVDPRGDIADLFDIPVFLRRQSD